MIIASIPQSLYPQWLRNFISTQYAKQLLWATKTKAREKNYKFAWTRNEKVLVKEKEGAPKIWINSEDDIHLLK